MAKLENRVVRWASRPYREGEGLHTNLFHAAILMLEDGHEEEAVFSLIRAAADQVTDRYVPDREIRDAILYARLRLDGGGPAGPRWPAPEPLLRTEVIRAHPWPLAELRRNLQALPQSPGWWLERAFDPADFVCLGYGQYTFQTAPRARACELSEQYSFEYVNPNAMTAEAGLTRDGTVSAHCLANTGPRRRLIIEFDAGTLAEHAACLRWLSRAMRLELVVWSGGKSLHGWFDVRGRVEEQAAAFFVEAVRVGADARLWSPCQFVRLPAGINSRTGRIQKVLYCAL
jgi:hypothetical protein